MMSLLGEGEKADLWLWSSEVLEEGSGDVLKGVECLRNG